MFFLSGFSFFSRPQVWGFFFVFCFLLWPVESSKARRMILIHSPTRMDSISQHGVSLSLLLFPKGKIVLLTAAAKTLAGALKTGHNAIFYGLRLNFPYPGTCLASTVVRVYKQQRLFIHLHSHSATCIPGCVPLSRPVLISIGFLRSLTQS